MLAAVLVATDSSEGGVHTHHLQVQSADKDISSRNSIFSSPNSVIHPLETVACTTATFC